MTATAPDAIARGKGGELDRAEDAEVGIDRKATLSGGVEAMEMNSRENVGEPDAEDAIMAPVTSKLGTWSQRQWLTSNGIVQIKNRNNKPNKT